MFREDAPLPAFDGILLKPRCGRHGVDVEYRPLRLSAMLLGQEIDAAVVLAGRLHDQHRSVHEVALARALPGPPVSDARRAAWDLAVLATEARSEAHRVEQTFAPSATLSETTSAVRAAADELRRALGDGAGPRGQLVPATVALEGAASRLQQSLSNLVIRLSAVAPIRLAGLAPEPREVVHAAWSSPALLLARLRRDLGPLIRDVRAEPALAPANDGDGVGSVVTATGRITYGVRVAAGCISRAFHSNPADRLFKPGGAAVQLLDRFAPDMRTVAMVMAALDPGVPWSLAGADADA